MDRLVRLVQWFNHACPWNKHKPALARWAAGRMVVAGEPVICKGIQGGLRMRLDLTHDYQRRICLNAYEPVPLQLMRRILRPGDTVVDGGANIGLMTLVASQCVGPAGHVYAFEPQPEALDRLNENLRLNDAQNVTVIPKCSWEKAGTSTLFADRGRNIGQVSMRWRAEDEEPAGTAAIEAETIRMDEAVQGGVRLIKLDVEGAELPALRGAQGLFDAGPLPHLIAELNYTAAKPFGYHPTEVVDWLLGQGNYRLHLLKSRGRRRISAQALLRMLRERPNKLRNVWFEPGDRSCP